MLTCNYRAKWVRVNGTKYQKPFAIIIAMEDDDLKFGNVENIYVDGLTVWFEFVPLDTFQFCTHFNAYALTLPRTPSTCNHIIKHSNLPDFHPYGIYRSSTVCSNDAFLYVVLKCNVYLDEE